MPHFFITPFPFANPLAVVVQISTIDLCFPGYEKRIIIHLYAFTHIANLKYPEVYVLTSPTLAGLGAGDNKKSLLRSSIHSQGLL